MGRSRRGWKEEVDGENGEEGGSGQQIAHLEAGGGEGEEEEEERQIEGGGWR